MSENKFNPTPSAKIPTHLKPRVRMSVSDGFQNLMTGYGIGGVDNQRSFSFTQQLDAFDYLTLDGMYTSSGFARQVIDLIPNEMCRQWITIENDPDGHLLRYMERLKAKPLFTNALQWSRLYGGALIFMVIDDGRDIWEPVDFDNIKDIKMMKVFDRFQTTVINFYSQMIDIDKYGHPEIYQIIDPVRGILYSIHESRTIRFDGINSTLRFRLANFGWSQSVLNLCWNALVQLDTAYTSASRSMQTNNETVVGITNLMEFLTDEAQTQALTERVQYLNQTRNTMNALLKDQLESIERLNNTFTDVPAMIKEFGFQLCAITGIPYNRFFGDSTGGLSGAGQYDTNAFDDDIKSQQENKLLPAIDKLLYYIQKAKNNPVKPATEGKEYKAIFNPLRQQNEKTKAETEEIQARTDTAYYQNNIKSSDEIRSERGFVDPSLETSESSQARKKELNKELSSYSFVPTEEKDVLANPRSEQPYASSLTPEDPYGVD